VQLARWLGRLVVIAGSAYLAAFGAGGAFYAGGAVQDLVSNGFSSSDRLAKTIKIMSEIGLMAGTDVAPIGALIALVILWGTELRKSVPFVGAVTIATAAFCGAMPWPRGSFPAAILISIVATLGAGVLAMIMASAIWPVDPRRRRISGARGHLITSVRRASQA